jgi:hypothetical protein
MFARDEKLVRPGHPRRTCCCAQLRCNWLFKGDEISPAEPIALIILETLEPPTTIVPDDAILDAFQQQSFSSVKEWAKLTCIPRRMDHWGVTRTLGFVVKHF